MTDPVRLATDAAGGGAKLARALGITRSAVCQWKKIPTGRLLEIERITNVPRQHLRPDLFVAAVDSRPEGASP